jgi:hypothetical protein
MYGCHMFQPHEAVIRGVIISVKDKENKHGKRVVMGKHYSVSETQDRTEL